MKRGQVSVFIIVGLLILVMIGITLFLFTPTTVYVDEKTIQPIQKYVENCLEQTTIKGIAFISMQGGYYLVSDPMITFFTIRIPYYFYNGNISIPSQTSVQNGLADYIENNLDSCLSENFTYQHNIDNIIVSPTYDGFKITLTMPVTIQTNKTITTIKEYSIAIKTSLSSMIILSSEIINKMDNSSYLPLSVIYSLVEEKGYTLEIISTENGHILSIKDPTIQYNGEDALFSFAIGFSNDAEKIVIIDDIPVQQIYVHYPFLYQVHGNGTNIKYTDATSLFDIEQDTGIINWTPGIKDIGKHNIIIKAQNNEGYDYETFTLEVVSLNTAPMLKKIQSFFAKVGEQIYYEVSAYDVENDTLKYFSSDPNFPINAETGVINKTFYEPYEAHSNITVIDSAGNYNIEELFVKVS